MGLLSRILSPKDDDLKIEISFSESETNTNKPPIEFSDNEPDLLNDINSTDKYSPDKKLPFEKICPNCGTLQETEIKRKKVCKDCGKKIHVRTTQDLYSSSALTDEQVNNVDFYMTLKNTISITKKDYKKTEKELMNKWSRDKVNIYDVLWSLYNNPDNYFKNIDKSYDKKYQMRDFLRTKAYLDEAAATYQGNRGHDPKPYLELARNNLVQMAAMEERVKGLTVNCYDCCDNCLKFKNKTFSIEFLNKTPVLPIKTCTRPFKDGSKYIFCICNYNEYYKWLN